MISGFVLEKGALKRTVFYISSSFEVPFPITGLHSPCPALLDLACELRAKPMPPVTNGLITYVYASFMQEVLHISQ